MIGSQRCGTRQWGCIQEHQTGDHQDKARQKTPGRRRMVHARRARNRVRGNIAQKQKNTVGKRNAATNGHRTKRPIGSGNQAALGEIAGVHGKRFERQECEGQRAQTRHGIARPAERDYDCQEHAQERAPDPQDRVDLHEPGRSLHDRRPSVSVNSSCRPPRSIRSA